jgi:uncharacterized membrane protein YhaH (DUF805 family)
MNWYLDALKNKYATFSGRARRTEYWMFFLFYFLIALAIVFVEAFIHAGGILGILFGLAMLVPSLAVTVRRLHDTSRTGWWILITLIPGIGAIILLIFMVLDSTPEGNDYGPNPKVAG